MKILRIEDIDNEQHSQHVQQEDCVTRNSLSTCGGGSNFNTTFSSQIHLSSTRCSSSPLNPLSMGDEIAQQQQQQQRRISNSCTLTIRTTKSTEEESRRKSQRNRIKLMSCSLMISSILLFTFPQITFSFTSIFHHHRSTSTNSCRSTKIRMSSLSSSSPASASKRKIDNTSSSTTKTSSRSTASTTTSSAVNRKVMKKRGPSQDNEESRTTKKTAKAKAKFQYDTSQSEALLSSIAVAAQMDDAVASVYSSSQSLSSVDDDQTTSTTYYEYDMVPGVSSTEVARRPNGRPESVPGAMGSNTMRTRYDAQAQADALIADGYISPDKRKAFVEGLTQQDKEKRTYNSVVNDVDEESLWENTVPSIKKKTTKKAKASSVVESSTSVAPPKKRKRGRPKKTATILGAVEPMSNSKLTGSSSSSSKATNTNSNKKQQQEKKSSSGNTKKKRGVVKQVAKRNPKRKRGKLTGDKLSLQKYYETSLLKAHEEYSLGMKVKFLMKSEEVYEGISAHLGRQPTIAEWAIACG